MATLSEHDRQTKVTLDNGAGVETVHTRVAELLDDVTVAVAVVTDQTPQPMNNLIFPTQTPALSLPSSSTDGQPLVATPANADDVEILTTIELNAIKIKGRAGGIAIEIGEGNWPDILNILDKRLKSALNFFRGGQVVLDVDSRPLTNEELHEFCVVLKANEMNLAMVRSHSERTFAAAQAIGLTAVLDGSTTEQKAVAQPAVSNENETISSYYVYRGNLRSGQVLQRNESIVVIGDANPGSRIISAGDILVWGRLRGVVHAGAEGNQQAIVTALDLEPVQLRIAHCVATEPPPGKDSPGGWGKKRAPEKRPEVAYVADDQIMMEPWDASKPGIFANLRR
jgi:septum site-determining protein MinC